MTDLEKDFDKWTPIFVNGVIPQEFKKFITHTLQTYRDEIVAGLPEKRNRPHDYYIGYDKALDDTLTNINSVSKRRGL